MLTAFRSTLPTTLGALTMGGLMLYTASAGAQAPPASVDAPLPSAATPHEPQVIPPPLVPPEPRPQYRSNSWRITGIVMTSLGGAMLAGGLVVTAQQQISYHPPSPLIACAGPGSCPDRSSLAPGTILVGVPLIALSAVTAAVGIPLWLVGSRSAKAERETGIPAWAVPTIAAGPRAVALRWTF